MHKVPTLTDRIDYQLEKLNIHFRDVPTKFKKDIGYQQKLLLTTLNERDVFLNRKSKKEFLEILTIINTVLDLKERDW